MPYGTKTIPFKWIIQDDSSKIKNIPGDFFKIFPIAVRAAETEPVFIVLLQNN